MVLKATEAGRLVGFGARPRGERRLPCRAAHRAPDLQGRGIGTHADAANRGGVSARARFELFTGSRSEGNIRLYQRLGYQRSHEQVLSPAVTLVYLEKTAMSVRIVRLGRRAPQDEGTRLGTVRRPPRGVPERISRASTGTTCGSRCWRPAPPP